MNLDDLSAFRVLDKQNLIEQIDNLPDQISSAYQFGQEYPLPQLDGIRQVAISGMGASIISADLLAAYAAPDFPFPLVILRDYDLPAWCRGPETFVIASSHSGNTEETLHAFDQAVERGCRVMTLGTGGLLAEKARALGKPAWIYPNKNIPRIGSGFSFGLLHTLFCRLGWMPDPQAEVADMQHAMRNTQTNLMVDVPVVYNPAKRLAGQLYGRWVTIFAADYLAPLARFWKNQINGMSRALGHFDTLPEADHTTLVGLEYPAELISKMIAVFLDAPDNHPRNLQRLDLTRKVFLRQGFNTDVIHARGNTRLARIWTSLLFADYTTYYLAMAYRVNPSTSLQLSDFKTEMAKLENQS
jgi:glucose/mannose-6-phosphate isomerase